MDWPVFSQVERQARRMHEMVDRLGIDALGLVRLRCGEDYAEARSRCLKCRATHVCLAWLDNAAASAERPDFCPNLTLFETCPRRQRIN